MNVGYAFDPNEVAFGECYSTWLSGMKENLHVQASQFFLDCKSIL